MLIITELIRSFHERFQGPVIEEIVTDQLEDTRVVLAQIERAIEQNAFLKHMALAKQMALIAWAQKDPLTYLKMPGSVVATPMRKRSRKSTIL